MELKGDVARFTLIQTAAIIILTQTKLQNFTTDQEEALALTKWELEEHVEQKPCVSKDSSSLIICTIPILELALY